MESRYRLLYAVDTRIDILAIFYFCFVFVSLPLERGLGGQYYCPSAMITDNRETKGHIPSDRVEATGIFEHIRHLGCSILVSKNILVD